MSATLYDSPVFRDVNQVGMADRAESVGDGYRRSTHARAIEHSLHTFLRHRTQSASRLIRT